MTYYIQTALSLIIIIAVNLTPQQLHGADTKCQISALWDEWPPYQYTDKAGNLTGFDIEFMRTISRDMKCEIVFKQRPWARGLVEHKAGNIDVIMHADFTEERDKWARFSHPYYTDTMSMLVRAGEIPKYPFESLEDIIGTDIRIGVIRDVYYGDEFEKMMENPAFRQHIHYTLDSVNVRHKMLKLDRIDAIIRNELVSPDVDEGLERHPLTIHKSDQHVMFSRKSTTEEMVRKFNISLENIRRNGAYDKLIDKYLVLPLEK